MPDDTTADDAAVEEEKADAKPPAEVVEKVVAKPPAVVAVQEEEVAVFEPPTKKWRALNRAGSSGDGLQALGEELEGLDRPLTDQLESLLDGSELNIGVKLVEDQQQIVAKAKPAKPRKLTPQRMDKMMRLAKASARQAEAAQPSIALDATDGVEADPAKKPDKKLSKKTGKANPKSSAAKKPEESGKPEPKANKSTAKKPAGPVKSMTPAVEDSPVTKKSTGRCISSSLLSSVLAPGASAAASSVTSPKSKAKAASSPSSKKARVHPLFLNKSGN